MSWALDLPERRAPTSRSPPAARLVGNDRFVLPRQKARTGVAVRLQVWQARNSIASMPGCRKNEVPSTSQSEGIVMPDSPVISCSPRHLPRSRVAARRHQRDQAESRQPSAWPRGRGGAAGERGRKTRSRRDPLLGQRRREPHRGLHRDARPRPARPHLVAPQRLGREGQRALRGVRHRAAGAHRALDGAGLAGRRWLLVEPRHRRPADRPRPADHEP